MEGIMFITLIICCFLTAVITNCMLSKNKYCNSNYNLTDEYSKLEIDEPEYKVHAIREVCPKNKGLRMAEYTLWNFYLDNKNSVKSQELIIYDKIGKYQIGDILKLTKC